MKRFARLVGGLAVILLLGLVERSWAVPSVSSVSSRVVSITGGMTIVLNGSGFTAGDTVKIDGVDAGSVHFNSSSNLVVGVPALASIGAKVITIRQSGTNYLFPSLLSAYNPALPPTILSIRPSSGPVVGGNTVFVTGTNFSHDMQLRVGTKSPYSMNVSSSATFTFIVPKGDAMGPVDLSLLRDEFTQVYPATYTYLVSPAPTITDISPDFGDSTRSDQVNIYGTNFGPGSVVVIGTSTVNTTYSSPFFMYCRTDPSAPGPRTLRVINTDGQTVVFNGSFTYVDPPIITGITPASGPIDGGTLVTITGRNFVANSVVIFESENGLNPVITPTSITVTTPKISRSGPVYFYIQTPTAVNGSSEIPFLFLGPAPILESITPNQGYVTGGTQFVIKGKNFYSGMAVLVGGKYTGGGFISSTTFNGTTVGGNRVGFTSVTVMNPDESSDTKENFFEFIHAPDPVIGTITPNSSINYGQISFTLTGQNFFEGIQMKIAGRDVSINSRSSFTIQGVIPSTTAIDAADIVLTDYKGAVVEKVGGFNYLDTPAPLMTLMDPATGYSFGSNVILKGDNFYGYTKIAFGTSANAPTHFGFPVDSHTFRFRTPTFSSIPSGKIDVIMTRQFDQKMDTLEQGFEVIDPPSPIVASVEPSTGPSSGGTRITVRGTTIASGAQVLVGTIPANIYSYGDGATWMGVITPGVSGPGPRRVTVINPDQKSGFLENAFTYETGAGPIITSVEPTTGTTRGDNSINIYGQNLGVNARVLFGTAPATSVSYNGPDQLSVNTPAHTAGPKSVTVINSDGQQTTWSGGSFNYFAPPVITSMSPNRIPLAGNVLVTVTGSNFNPTSVIYVDHPIGRLETTYVNSTTLRATFPSYNSVGTIYVYVTNYEYVGVNQGVPFTYQGDAPVISSIVPNQGTVFGGENLTFTGRNFLPGTSVRIDGRDVPNLQYVSSTTLTGTAPLFVSTGTGPQRVELFNPDEQTFSSSNLFTLVAAPDPLITEVRPATATVFGVDKITLVGQNLLGNAGYARINVGNSAASIFSGNQQDQIVFWAPGETLGPKDILYTRYDGKTVFISSGITYVAASTPVITSITPNEVYSYGDSDIRIVGEYLYSSLDIRIGNQSASIQSYISSTTVVVRAPNLGKTGPQPLTIRRYSDNASISSSSAITYIDAPAPVIDSVTPFEGPTIGGTAVTIQGGPFAIASAVTLDGKRVSFSFVSTATIRIITSTSTAGAKDIVITNPDGKSVLNAGGFTFVSSGAPEVTDIQPPTASTLGNSNITIQGNNFGPTTQVKIGGVDAQRVQFIRNTVLSIRTPVGQAGLKDLEIINVDGQRVLVEDAIEFVNPPIITAVSPNHGPVAGGTTVTLTVTDLKDPQSVRIDGNYIDSLNVIDSSHVSFVTPDSEGEVGYVRIQITNGDDQSHDLDRGFLYEGARPTIQSITPNTGGIFQTQRATVTGTNFNDNARVRVGINEAPINSISQDGTSMIINIPAGTKIGPVDVVVTNPDNQSAVRSNGYTYQSEGSLTITAIDEERGPSVGGNWVYIAGTGFQPGTTVFFGSRKAVRVQDAEGSTNMQAVAPNNGGLGTVNIRVVNPDGASATLPNAYTYEQSPKPEVDDIDFLENGGSYGSIRGGDIVWVQGDNFSSEPTILFGGVSARLIRFYDESEILVEIPAHAAGVVDVEVINPDGQKGILTEAFTYAAVPRLTSISPRSGSMTGGTTVTLTGYDLKADLTLRIDGSEVPVQFINSTTLRFTTPFKTSAGTESIDVRDQDGTRSNSLVFSYLANDPTTIPIINSVSPNSGPVEGGTIVTITGKNFTNYSAVYFSFPWDEGMDLLYRDDTTIIFMTPPGSPGPKDVLIFNDFDQMGYVVNGFTYGGFAGNINNASAEARALPNPFMPSKGHSALTLFKLPANASVKIYTRRGELVKELMSGPTGEVDWDVKDSDGVNVASGAYTVYSEGDGQTVKFKIAIIR